MGANTENDGLVWGGGGGIKGKEKGEAVIGIYILSVVVVYMYIKTPLT